MKATRKHQTTLLFAFLPLIAWGATAPTRLEPARHAEALEILLQSVAFRTVRGAGQVRPYADYLRGLLLQAGFAPDDVRVEPFGSDGDATATLTARYSGRHAKLKPILLLGHLDVVEAKREDWQRDPFNAVVENGYVYARGIYDNKLDVTALISTFIALKRAGWKPRRDVILAFSGDEETSMASTRRLAEQLAGAEFALNGDAGGGFLAEEGDAAVAYGIQAGEKLYAEYTLTVTDPGGHSSRPTRTNAIYRLARVLARLDAYEFPIMRNELTQAYFQASASMTPGADGEAMKRFLADPSDKSAIEQLSRNPEYVGQLRTTCVATQLEGGHAPNALPQRAPALINCRIFPGVSFDSVKETLTTVVADTTVHVTQIDAGTIESATSPLRADVVKAVRRAVHASYPKLAVVPTMSAGATDGMHFRARGVPVYGVSGVYIKSSDDFAHGLNERVPLATVDLALAHWESLLRDLAR